MELLSKSVAPSTLDKRKASWKHWCKFKAVHTLSGTMINPSELDICLWLTFLRDKGLMASSIKAYMYALSAEIKFRGGTSFIKPYESWFIKATMRAIERGDDPCKVVQRQPLTTDLLSKVAEGTDFSIGDNFAYITMLFLGIFGLFRINELCFVQRGGVKKFIRFKDIVFYPDHAKISIFNTKTDRVVVKVVGKLSKGKICPYKILFNFYNSKLERKPDLPVFTTKRGLPITRQLLVKFLQDKMSKICPDVPVKAWNGISLRKGGATSAMRAGVSGEVIQKLGNWKSSVYVQYLTAAEKDIIKAQDMFAFTK